MLFNCFHCKAWKVGYNGLDITIDGNPRETVVMGESNGYEVTPSFLLPSQLVANIVVNNILVNSDWFEDNKEYDRIRDKYGQFNQILTFNSADLILDLHQLYNLRRLQNDS